VREVELRVGSLLIVFGIDDNRGFQSVVGGRIVISGLEDIRSVWGSPLMELGFVEEIVEVVVAFLVDFLEVRCSAVAGRCSVSRVVVLDWLRTAAGHHTVVLGARSWRSTPRLMRGHILVSTAAVLGYV